MWRGVVLVWAAASAALGSLLPLEPGRLRAAVGGFVVLDCRLDFPFGNAIPYHLQWDKDGETIYSWSSGDSEPRLADRWGGRVVRAALSEGGAEGGGLGGGAINVTAVRETDAGLYRCLVSFPNRTPPARNNGTFYYLDVDGSNLIATPPINVTVLEGERAEFECAPKSADSTVEWFKDGLPLGAIPELASRTERPPNGSLVVLRAASTDPGELECRVQEPAGQRQAASAYLDVQYKAKVVYAPSQRHLPAGKAASLDCHFSANPPLTNLRWEKDGFLFDPYNVPGVFYSRNGSLLFNQVDESHEGWYSCTPYNALGTAGPSPRVRVRVQRVPGLSVRPRPLYLARLAGDVVLPCRPDPADDTATVTWSRKDGGDLPIGRYSLDGGNLTISEIAEEDRGTYTCTVRNEVGDVSADTELVIENVPPRAPHSLAAVAGSRSLRLTWQPGHVGVEVDYHVWYRQRTESEWRTMKILSRGVTSATLVGLQPGAEYELRVLAQDHLGDGMFSKPLYVSTSDSEAEGEDVSRAQPVVTDTGLEVTARLLDRGLLVRWAGPATGPCHVRLYRGDHTAPLRDTRTENDYLLVPEVEEGERYEARVRCAGGGAGAAGVAVPRYGRRRAVAAGAAGGALLLAAAGVALWLTRRRRAAAAAAKRPR